MNCLVKFSPQMFYIDNDNPYIITYVQYILAHIKFHLVIYNQSEIRNDSFTRKLLSHEEHDEI